MEEKKTFKEYFVFQPLLLATMVIIGIILGKRIENSATPEAKVKLRNVTSIDKTNNAVEEVSRFIQARFIDSMSMSNLTDLAIKNMVKELDPYSTYYEPDKLIEIPFKNFKEAYGFNAFLLNNQWIVDELSIGSAAWKSPLEIGDQIIKLNDSLISPKSFSKWSDTLLKGYFKTATGFQFYEFNKGEQTKIISVSAVHALSDKIGYIKINRFGDNVYDEFITAVDSLHTAYSINDLVLDLRDNAGGYIEECIRVLNQFFKDKNILLAYTEGRTVRKIEYKTDGRQLFNLGKLVVIINNGSASASEIFAGAIQDLDRGKVVGEHSYGKGLVQEQYMLSNGAALRLSVSRFYLPSGRSVDKSGSESPESIKHYSVTKKLLHAGNYIYPDLHVSQPLPNQSDSRGELIKSALLTYKLKYGSSGKDPVQSIFNSIISAQKSWSKAEKKDLLEDVMVAWGATLKDPKSVLKYQILNQSEIQTAIKALK